MTEGITPGQRLVRVLSLLLLVVGLFGCDHATKVAAKANLEGVAAVPLALGGAVELRYTENDDVAFSAFHQLGIPRSRPVFIGLGVLALGAIALAAVRRRSRSEPVDGATQAGMAFVLAGALGNLVDRVARGYVVDFIHVRGWPVFNVADIAVVVGVGLLVVARMVRPRSRASPEA